MKRERRFEIIRSTRTWAATLVEQLSAVDGGLYEELTLNDAEETELAVKTIHRIADSIRGVKSKHTK